MLKKIAFGTVCTLLGVAGAMAQNPPDCNGCPNQGCTVPDANDRASTSQKGSLLIFPKVEAHRTKASKAITLDTFIQISNDFNQDVHVLTFFVSEDCERLYTDIDLTKNQPRYWSAATGKGAGGVGVVSPLFSVPGGPKIQGTDEVVRGYLVVFAADPNNAQIRWNHLTGLATIVDYANGTAWEYSPYAFAVVDDSNAPPNGGNIGTPGTILMNGQDYQASFNHLLLEFFTCGSMAFSGGGVTVDHDTQVTLMINDIDVRQDHCVPRTKASYEIWNEDEASFVADYCVTCWDCDFLCNKGDQFTLETLGSFDRARARIDGIASVLCADLDPNVANEPDVCNHALLGVAAKYLTFNGTDIVTAGSHLVGTGAQCARLLYDVGTGEPEEVITPRAPKGGMGSK